MSGLLYELEEQRDRTIAQIDSRRRWTHIDPCVLSATLR